MTNASFSKPSLHTTRYHIIIITLGICFKQMVIMLSSLSRRDKRNLYELNEVQKELTPNWIFVATKHF